MRKIVAFLAMSLIALAARAQQACGVVIQDPPRLNKLNEVIFEMDPLTFPDPNMFKGALNLAASKWNQRCAPRDGEDGGGYPPAADHPLLVPRTTPNGAPLRAGQGKVPVGWGPGQASEGDPCPTPENPDRQCYPIGEAIPTDTNGWEIKFYEKAGPAGPDGRATSSTVDIIRSYGGLLETFMHEIGHVLGLGHDTCPASSLLHNGIDAVMGGQNRDPAQEHCDRLEQIYDPPDPNDDISELGDDDLCRLLIAYCDESNRLWPKTRSTCTWIPETFLGYYFARETQVVSIDYWCVFDSGPVVSLGEPWPYPTPSRYKSPVLAVTPFELLPNGDLKVSGWVWGRTDPVRQLAIWIDGAEATVLSLQMDLPEPGPCEAGYDPIYCHSNTGFVAVIRSAGLAPGPHRLQLIATDNNDDPMPTPFERSFHLAPPAPNQPPVAVDDEHLMSVGVGGPAPELLELLDNDFDPEGDPVKLSANPILVAPAQGTIERLNDHQLRYTPFAHRTGPESFRYEIVDSFGNTASARVEITILEVILPPH